MYSECQLWRTLIVRGRLGMQSIFPSLIGFVFYWNTYLAFLDSIIYIIYTLWAQQVRQYRTCNPSFSLHRYYIGGQQWICIASCFCAIWKSLEWSGAQSTCDWKTSVSCTFCSSSCRSSRLSVLHKVGTSKCSTAKLPVSWIKSYRYIHNLINQIALLSVHQWACCCHKKMLLQKNDTCLQSRQNWSRIQRM